MSTPFRERDPVLVGLVGIALIAGLLVAAFRAGDLPLIGGGDTYYARFTEASGIKADDEVRIAGVRVGKVTSVGLEDGQVEVAFKVDTPSRFGTETGAEIKVKTLLGAMYLALRPAGSGQLEEGGTIPVARTRSAYDVVQAFTGLAERTDDIDLPQLRTSLDALAEATSTTPAAFQDALKGVSALSRNVAKRDQQIGTLLRNLKQVSGILSERDQNVVSLMRNGDVLLRALVDRRESIHRLLVSTSTLSEELTTLVRRSRADLSPALQNLQTVVDVLLKNQSNLDESLRLLAPFYRVFANTLGSGPWFDNWIQNLPPL